LRQSCPTRTRSVDTIKTHCFSRSRFHRSPRVHVRVNHFLYFFQIFKDQT
jgi:hypothetical protein